MSQRVEFNKAKDLLNQIESLRRYCDNEADVLDLMALLPLLLESNSEEVSAAKKALLEMLTKKGGRVLRME